MVLEIVWLKQQTLLLYNIGLPSVGEIRATLAGAGGNILAPGTAPIIGITPRKFLTDFLRIPGNNYQPRNNLGWGGITSPKIFKTYQNILPLHAMVQIP